MTGVSWRDPPDLLDLPSGVIDVWRAPIAGRAEARDILHELLGRYLRRAPATITFATGPYGKPALAGEHPPALEFNMSHTRGLALYALARDVAVGVDVERPRPGLDAVRLARRFVTAEEASRLADLALAERDAAFLRAWVRHEATVKCLGTGVGASDLSALGPAQRPWVRELDPGDGAAGAIAAAQAPADLRCWAWRARSTRGHYPAEP